MAPKASRGSRARSLPPQAKKNLNDGNRIAEQAMSALLAAKPKLHEGSKKKFEHKVKTESIIQKRVEQILNHPKHLSQAAIADALISMSSNELQIKLIQHGGLGSGVAGGPLALRAPIVHKVSHMGTAITVHILILEWHHKRSSCFIIPHYTSLPSEAAVVLVFSAAFGVVRPPQNFM
jgi:hypothetical protein